MAGLTAIVIAQLESLGSFEAFLVAVFITGGIQVAIGIIQAGSFAAFFPSNVIKGLLAAIGIILILKQFPHLFGHDPDWMGDMGFAQRDGKNTFTEIVATMFDIHPGSMTVGIGSLLLLLFRDRTPLKKSGLPPPLAVVVLGIAQAELFRWVQTGKSEHLSKDVERGIKPVPSVCDRSRGHHRYGSVSWNWDRFDFRYRIYSPQ